MTAPVRPSRPPLLKRTKGAEGAAVLVWISDTGGQGEAVDALAARAAELAQDSPTGVLAPRTLDRKGGRLRLAMADPGGAPLESRLAEGPMDLADALDVAIALAEALVALHGRRLTHGRLSPAALFLSADGDVSVALSPDSFRARPDEIDQVAARTVRELAYLAPEQTGRTAYGSDARSDLYALGAMLFELLTGRPPFQARERLELAHSHLAVAPPPVEGAPGPVAAIVARLLAKAPDERYQSAYGLLADLRHCRAVLEERGTIPDFPLGAQDARATFRLPNRLYGRDTLLAQLSRALTSAAMGATELVLLGGYSGAGKSSLVNRFLEDSAGVTALTGKYDQIQTLPYKAIHEALRGHVRGLMSEDQAARDAWRARFEARLHESAPLLVEFLPELALIVGPQPAPEAMEATERDQRFRIAALGLFEMLATPARPAVLFFDDLQWADAASIALIENILSAGDLPYLTVVGAFRANEVADNHPLHRMVANLAEAGLRAMELEVGPLGAAETRELVADALGQARSDVADLADALHAKTQGNPFHLRQLLSMTVDTGAVAFDSGAGTWRWDMARIREIVVHADIAALMTEKLDRLSAEARETLRLAACIGAEFGEDELAVLDARGDDSRRRGLAEAEQAGLIVRAAAEDGAERYAFSHDRVQEAAYARLAEAERAAAHHRLGLWLLDAISEPEEDDRLFFALDQITRGLALVTDPALGRRVADAALVAARRAKGVAAYDLAQRHVEAVASLPTGVSGADWATDPGLAFRLEMERLEAAFLIDGFEAARPHFEALMANLSDDADKARVHQLLITLFTFRADYASAIEYGVAGLRLLGVSLSGPYGPKIMAGLARCQLQLLRHDVYDFSGHPRMQDERVEQIMEMLLILSTPAFLENKDLFVLLSLKMFSLTLKHGLTHAGIASISYYALVNYIAFGAVERAWRIVRNLYPLFDSFGVSNQVRGRVNYIYCMVLAWYKERYPEVLKRLETGIDASWKAADLEYVGYYYFGVLKYLFVMGAPLGELSARMTEIGRYRRQLRHDVLGGLFDTYQRVIEHATGPRDAPLWSEADVALESRQNGEANEGGFYQAYFLLAHVFGDIALAAEVYRKLRPLENFTIMGPDDPDYHLCGLLVHSRWAGRLPADIARTARRRLRRHARRLEKLAARWPTNHRPHHALAQAELTRMREGAAAALPLYDEAARLAAAEGLSHYAGLACDCAAEACAAAGLAADRDRFLTAAHGHYAAWGAERKAAEIRAEHPGLFKESEPAAAVRGGGSALDLDTLIKASHAIFESLDFDRLLERLMAIVVENAGAEFGALMLVEDGGTRLAVEARVDGGAVQVASVEGAPALDALSPGRLPRDIIASVAATAAPFDLDSAPADFRASRYMREKRPKSAACLPVVRSGAVEAVIYLENSLTAGVFTEARREMLQTLASFAAISLANARLYARQEEALAMEKRAIEELTRVNELKDAFLANTSHELRTPLNGIIGLADSLIGGIHGQLPPRTKETLGLIVTSGRRLSSLVNDILDFSRLKEDELSLNLTPVSLHSAADVVCALVAPRARKNRVRVVNGIPTGLPAVLADEDRLQQILLNLVDNGVKFAEGGEVRIDVEMREGRAHVSVTDNGPGIAPDDHERIFQTFEQADGSIQRRFGGAGLGLAITRALVGLHGGSVVLDSDLGKGARFTFDVALADGAAAPARTEPPLSELLDPDEEELAKAPEPVLSMAPEQIGPRYRALVVDDDPVNLQVLKNYLELNNYDAVLASDGPEALARLDEGYEPDVVLLDVMMPKMSGYEVCRAIRERSSANRLPVIMLTAKNRVDDLRVAFEAGANDYLAKPFSREELFARMLTHIELAQINVAYERFVPVEFLRLLDRRTILDIKLGDNAAREMAVMFTDIRAFTSLAEKMAPSESFDFISAYFRRLGPLVQENQGFLNQFLGDGMMALFPRSPEDAVKTAVGIQHELDFFNDERASLGQPPIRTGIGLHAGDLILGIIGDQYRRSGNVVSDAVNLASRIEGLTAYYGVRIAASRNLIDRVPNIADYPYRELDIVRVKGKQAPVMVCEVFAGDQPDSIALKNETLKVFNEAVGEFRAGRFEHARDLFEAVLRANPDDSVATIFRDRCIRYIEQGAPTGWQGVETIELKPFGA